MNSDEKSLTIDTLLELAKKSKLNNNQKNKIVQIVENMDNVTETQRERFIMYYGLNTNGLDFKNMKKIAKIYKCTISAIRISIVSVRNKLVRLNEGFEVIEQVLNECKDR